MAEPRHTAHDAGARALELGLAAFLVLAPLPFGAVGPRGRLALELGAFALLALLALRAWFLPTPLPPRRVCAGLAGLVALAAIQALPVGDAAVAWVSPQAQHIRSSSIPPPAAAAAEQRLLGQDTARLDRPGTLSLDSAATASALRTGCALAAVLLVATAVAGLRGGRAIALALLGSAGFQGLYGLLVVASGHDRIWHVPKEHFLDNATGTFVNRNHFACLLAMSLAGAAAVVLDTASAAKVSRAPRRLAAWLGREGARSLTLAVPFVVGLAGLLLSFSRAGIALGCLAVAVTVLGAGHGLSRRARALILAAAAATAVLPLAQIGALRLVDRYAETAQNVLDRGGRLRVLADAAAIVPDFPLLGCGYGAFAATYPTYRSPEVRKYFAHVHNDPLQALVEGGLVGLGLLALVAWPVLRALPRSLAGGQGALGVGFAAGLTAMLLHGLVDFNFHIPANAATAAALAGLVLGLPWNPRD